MYSYFYKFDQKHVELVIILKSVFFFPANIVS